MNESIKPFNEGEAKAVGGKKKARTEGGRRAKEGQREGGSGSERSWNCDVWILSAGIALTVSSELRGSSSSASKWGGGVGKVMMSGWKNSGGC